MQQGNQQGRHVLGDQLRTLRCGVNPVLLNRARHCVDMVVKHRHQRHMMLLGGIAKDGIEAFDKVRSVVGRQCNAHQQHADMRRLQGGQHGVQVLPRHFERQTAQAVIAAELNHDHLRTERNDGVHACHGILGRIPAHALIDDMVVIAPVPQEVSQRGWIAFGFVQSVAGRDAVAKTNKRLLRCGGAQPGRDQADCQQQAQTPRCFDATSPHLCSVSMLVSMLAAQSSSRSRFGTGTLTGETA